MDKSTKDKGRKKRTKWVAMLGISFILFGAFVQVKDELFLVSKNLDIFAAAYKHISVNYVDETDPEKMVKVALDAMLSDLDPYTEYVPESEMDDFRQKYVDTKFGGIGARIFTRNDEVFISEPVFGSPADKAGLRAGDRIVSVEGVPLIGKTSADVSQLLKGKENTAITFGVKRAITGEEEEIVVTRDIIRQANVSYATTWDGGIGYIRLDKFLSNAGKEVEESLLNLQRQGELKGLVLDLRNNGGGILQEAVKILNLFVDKNQVVVSRKGRNAAKNLGYKTVKDPIAKDLPLVVLINGRSASASEIVAGALQDFDRAVILGERSFGKGLIQESMRLPYENLVKVTVAKYYTPSGRCIQALDYVKKDANGKALRLPDSLINEYTTSSGRSVYDGSGIHPDMVSSLGIRSRIAQTLLSRFLIFDFATQFASEHPSIADVRKFQLSDKEYESFVNYLSGKDYNYNTRSEELLAQLKKQAAADKKSDEVMAQIAQLEEQINESKEQDLYTHKEEIKLLLSTEIASRYHNYQESRIGNTLQGDEQFLASVALLADKKKQYYAILAGEGEYKLIGKPQSLLASVD